MNLLRPLAYNRDQQGVALIMVLLVVALMAIVATQLSSLVHLNIRQASNREQYQQAYWYALGGERVARGLIEASIDADQRVHNGQAWASPLLVYPIDGGSISLSISDQRSCFNLNVLSLLQTPQDATPPQPPQPIRQLDTLLQQLQVDPSRTAEWLEPLRDWVDQDGIPGGLYGAEDLAYNGKQPPYLPPNQRLTDLSELHLIDAFLQSSLDPDSDLPTVTQLRQWLCTLPDDNQLLNLNTLPPEQAPLLSAILGDQVDPAAIQALLELRPDDGYGSVDQFWALLAADPQLMTQIDASAKDLLSVSSDFFLVRTEVTYYDASLVLYSRLNVRDGKAAPYQRHYGDING